MLYWLCHRSLRFIIFVQNIKRMKFNSVSYSYIKVEVTQFLKNCCRWYLSHSDSFKNQFYVADLFTSFRLALILHSPALPTRSKMLYLGFSASLFVAKTVNCFCGCEMLFKQLVNRIFLEKVTITCYQRSILQNQTVFTCYCHSYILWLRVFFQIVFSRGVLAAWNNLWPDLNPNN